MITFNAKGFRLRWDDGPRLPERLRAGHVGLHKSASQGQSKARLYHEQD